MEEMLQNIQNKELIVRKRLCSFLEKILRFYDYEIRHDIYKGIIYSEMEVRTPFEEKTKNLYDGFIYLVNNRMNPLSRDLLSKFFYIIYGTEFNDSLLLRLSSKTFYLSDLSVIEKAIEYHLFVYNELKEIEEKERTIISLMFLNYMFLKHDIPCVHFLRKDLELYIKYRDEYFKGNKGKMFEHVYLILKKSKFQDKDFTKNLKPIAIKDIYYVIEEDKEMLTNEYRIKSLYLYGSFAKNKQRIDSDIDLIARFSLDLTYEEKKQRIEELKKHYLKIFNRYVDITDIGDYLNDEFIKEVTCVKKIF